MACHCCTTSTAVLMGLASTLGDVLHAAGSSTRAVAEIRDLMMLRRLVAQEVAYPQINADEASCLPLARTHNSNIAAHVGCPANTGHQPARMCEGKALQLMCDCARSLL